MRPNQSLYSKIALLVIVAIALVLIVVGGLLAGWNFSFLISETAQAIYAVMGGILIIVFLVWIRNKYV
jgi:hypothetical protein